MMAGVGEHAERRPGRPRDARVDQQIVEATLAEVTEKGFGAASIESIASRAGVGKATIYRRWPNREALLRFVAMQVGEGRVGADTGDLRKDLLSIFETQSAEFYEGTVAGLMPDLIAEAARDAGIRDMLRSVAEDRRTGAVDALRRAAARGELRPGVDIETAVDMIAGSLLYRSLVLGETSGGSDVTAKAVDIALDGLLAT